MFRVILAAVGMALLLAGVISICYGWPLIPLAVLGVLLIVGIVFERYVYKPIRSEPPGAGWERTAERFNDPSSGQDVAVYYNASTGERRYVAD